MKYLRDINLNKITNSSRFSNLIEKSITAISTTLGPAKGSKTAKKKKSLFLIALSLEFPNTLKRNSHILKKFMVKTEQTCSRAALCA